MTKKVGIFVNASDEMIMKMIKMHGLDYVQLHGNESPAFCRLLSSETKVIKAFPHYMINEKEYLDKYKDCELFVFDTASVVYGGSGKKFDWSMLNDYKGPKPYLLAGGISENDVESLIALKNKNGFLGIDINSKFEDSPGYKNIEKIKSFLKLLRNEK